MGTNYYHRINICPTCGHSENVEHIGKSSVGWRFSFHGTYDIKSYSDWLFVLASEGKIYNEYNEEVTLKDFKELVNEKKGGTSHAGWCRENRPTRYGYDDWEDKDGNSFSGYEFS